MPGYDFKGLSPSDFEALCRDLLERRLEMPLQAFTTGRDGGIDLRHASGPNKECIVQCKHFARSGYAKLKSSLTQHELPKVKRLRPKRYVLATSVGLSPGNVDELFELLSPYCLSKHDIIGCDELNASLRQYGDIEQAHLKLWLTSRAVLDRVLHNDLFVQSLLTQEQIERKLGMYVHTRSFERARAKLDEERVCILSGLPGVGKTTLAELLIIEYLMNDWELVTIHQNVTEGQRLYNTSSDTKQIIYYDDFLGQISSGEKLGKNEDRALLQLVASVGQTANKRFILTTREYILAQAKAEHEQLARSNVDLYRFVVACSDYSELDKARILANHLYFSHVPQEQIAALVERQAYRRILAHRNYNPRIIEWMTQTTETASCAPADYPRVFMERLEDPTQLWRHAFENQISEASRHLLLALASCGDGVFIEDLRDAFDAFFLDRANRYQFPASPGSFEKTLEEMEGNFIRIERSGSTLVISTHNASILDFLGKRFSQHPEDALDVIACAMSFEQIERLLEVFKVDCAHLPKFAEKLAAALDRTLLAKSVRLNRTYQGREIWTRARNSIWERLRRSCEIVDRIGDDDLCDTTMEHLESHLDTIKWNDGELLEVISLLEDVERFQWCDSIRIRAWTEGFWERLVADVENLAEPLESLSATATWFEIRRDQFEVGKANQFAKDLVETIKREVRDNADPSDHERLSGDLTIVEELSESLGYELAAEVQWLEERLSECRSPDEEEDDDLRHERREATASIESLFESLLE